MDIYTIYYMKRGIGLGTVLVVYSTSALYTSHIVSVPDALQTNQTRRQLQQAAGEAGEQEDE